MNTLEVDKYLEKFKKFLGTYARDEMDFTLEKYSGIIINTDKREDPGEHWVAIYHGDITIYFDSFGLPPLQEEFIDFLDKLSPRGWFHNTITFQSVYQDTCGMYCVYFLACMFNYNDFNKFLEVFKHQTHVNDILAKILYKVQL